jgi:hypothetical protein
MMEDSYETWFSQVRNALASINMPIEEWQKAWEFDFPAEYRAGTDPMQTADKANRFWWYEQNKALKQDCRRTPNCWLPNGHTGECAPVS